MAYYKKRKEARVKVLTAEAQTLASKAKFCELVSSGKVKVLGRSKAALAEDLKTAGFAQVNDLLQTSLDEMTKERIDHLNNAKARKESELQVTLRTTESEVWENELLGLRDIVLQIQEDAEEQAAAPVVVKGKEKEKETKKKGKGSGKDKDADEDEDKNENKQESEVKDENENKQESEKREKKKKQKKGRKA